MLQRFLIAWLLCLPLTAQAAVFYPQDYKLDNGLELIVVPNHLAPAITQMVWYKVGSSDETAGQTGLAHYLEHLMFRGTSTMAPGDFSKIIAAQGGSDNAFTSYDYTAYHETVAADRLEMAMKMEADRMHNLQIKPETAVPELSVVLNERQQRTDNDPEGRFTEKVRNTLMPNYPYGTPVIGWKAQIEKLTAENATQFYGQHYAPNNAVVIISGDVEPEKVLQLAKSIYGVLPKHEIPPRQAFGQAPMPERHSLVMVDAGIEQPQLELNFVVPSYATQKAKEAYAYEVLGEALDGGEVGLLYKSLAVEQKLASGVEAGYDPDARGPAIFAIALTTRPGVDPKVLEKALMDKLQALAKTGLEEKTVKAAKERMRRTAVFARDDLMMPGYSFGMAITTGHSVNDVEAWPDRIEAVSLAEVNAALRDLMANPRTLSAMLLPDPNATQAVKEAAHPVINHDAGIR